MADVALGKYRLVAPLAQGGMAEIFLARHEGPGGFEREVVIKRVHPHLARDAQFVAMFLDEARLAARLSHPNIVQITDFGQSDGTYFLCMERLVGADLSAILNGYTSKGRALPAQVAALITSAACDALHYAHTLKDEKRQGLGIVHRDLSPSNIFITHQGAVKVLDFGIAKARGRAVQTEAGQIKGKIIYMSPEQARGEDVDARSDIFAMGVVLYEILTGLRPFQRPDTIASLAAVVEARVEPPKKRRADIPAELETIVMRALQRDPGDRFQTAGEMRLALDAYLASCTTAPAAAVLQSFMLEFLAEKEADSAEQSHRPERTLQLENATPKPAAPGVEPTSAARPRRLQGDTPASELGSKRGGEKPARGRVFLLAGGAALVVLVLLALVVRPWSSEPEGEPTAPQTVSRTEAPPASPGEPTSATPSAGTEPAVAAAPPEGSHPTGEAGEGARERAEPPPPPPPAEVAAETAKGFLSVQCAPRWCQVIIDGKDHGYSPVVGVPLRAGVHMVKATNPEVMAEQQRQVKIRPNQRETLKFEIQ